MPQVSQEAQVRQVVIRLSDYLLLLAGVRAYCKAVLAEPAAAARLTVRPFLQHCKPDFMGP